MNWLIDFGNTNVKWGYVLDSDYTQGGSLDYSCFTPVDLLEILYQKAPRHLAPKAVMIASVGKPSFVMDFCSSLLNRYHSDIQVIESSKVLLGVTNSYDEANRLGIDRLLAMGAAYKIMGSACIVVDIGTAITLDCIDQTGQHLGGLIVPGANLMLKSMEKESTKLNISTHINKTASNTPPLLGRNTSDAMLSGIHYLIVSFVQEHVKIVSKTLLNSQTPTLFLTGGGSRAFKDTLGTDWIYEPDLVLKGLYFLLITENNQ